MSTLYWWEIREISETKPVHYGQLIKLKLRIKKFEKKKRERERKKVKCSERANSGRIYVDMFWV
jgi:hypothetical protein